MPTFVVFLGVLSVLVLVHELGHFLAARILGIKVEEFAFGLPFTPPILKFKKGETQYSVYPLLFGGFVRLFGEETEVKGKDKGRDFWSRGKKQRLVVIGAGVFMNMVLALGLFMVLYSMVGIPSRTLSKVTVVKVTEDSPADKAGLKEEDRIVKVEGREIETTEEFSRLIKSWGGVGVNLTVQSGKGIPLFEGIAEQEITERNVYIVPRVDPPEGEGALGVVIVSYPYVQTQKAKDMPAEQFLIRSVRQGVITTGIWIGRVVDGLRSIGQSLGAGKAPEGVAGPVGIYQLTGVVAQGGLVPLLELTAILSVNLAVFNVLPIPALDGGRMFFIWLEWIRRKRLPAQVEQKINSWGMAALLTLLALISLQDVIRLGILERFLGK